jgi:outer membrane PBP1 activator LpoA protein
VYDTAELGSQQAYLRAQLEGADFIVGPLLGADVEQVIAQAGFVPTLALNVAQTDTPSLQSFYQFALASADEARAIAASAAASGATTAIALVRSNDRGYALLDNFRDEFAAHGGELLDFSGYAPGAQDFSQQIMGLMNITRSAQRQRRLAANLGVPVQFEPRLRQDVDLIFIQADASTGRLLAPQLRYQGTGDIPIYATSEIYQPGSDTRDTDLNGVIFPDAPAVVAPDGAAAELQRALQDYWPRRGGQVRLYSMGFDAHELVEPLYNGSRVWPVRGMSGDLELDTQGKIHRSLPLAQFRNGRPVALEQPRGAIDTRTLTGNR